MLLSMDFERKMLSLLRFSLLSFNLVKVYDYFFKIHLGTFLKKCFLASLQALYYTFTSIFGF